MANLILRAHAFGHYRSLIRKFYKQARIQLFKYAAFALISHPSFQ